MEALLTLDRVSLVYENSENRRRKVAVAIRMLLIVLTGLYPAVRSPSQSDAEAVALITLGQLGASKSHHRDCLRQRKV